MRFSEQQRKAFELYRKGENIFITGPGGCGKSALLKQIYHDAMFRKINVKMTALTGCAAILLGCKARTIHSFSGIGLGTGTIEDNIARVRKNLGKCSSWRAVQILIIDEVSMMSKKLIEILDAVARKVRKQPDKPFGGIQVIFSGDFFQIRPIKDYREENSDLFCFESPLWNQIFKKDNQIKMTQIFRQHDKVYADILNAIREGNLTEEQLEIMKSRVGVTRDTGDIKPTKLFPTRRQVDDVNQEELSKLPDENEHSYEMTSHTDLPMTATEMKKRISFSSQDIQRELEFLRRGMLCDENLRLRIGAQVMCIINKELPDKTYLCNGSQGIITGFTGDGLPIVKFHNDGKEEIIEKHTWTSEHVPGLGVSQIPLILSWAITVHKSQGSTLEMAEIDVGRLVFEFGQIYVALSRVKSLDGLYLISFDPSSIYVNQKVVEFYATFE